MDIHAHTHTQAKSYHGHTCTHTHTHTHRGKDSTTKLYPQPTILHSVKPSSTDRHLDDYQILYTMNDAAMNTKVQVSLRHSFYVL
jgi:hypothetical protein